MSYVPWAIFAMITYGIATFTLKYVFRTVSPAAGLTIANLDVPGIARRFSDRTPARSIAAILLLLAATLAAFGVLLGFAGLFRLGPEYRTVALIGAAIYGVGSIVALAG